MFPNITVPVLIVNVARQNQSKELKVLNVTDSLRVIYKYGIIQMCSGVLTDEGQKVLLCQFKINISTCCMYSINKLNCCKTKKTEKSERYYNLNRLCKMVNRTLEILDIFKKRLKTSALFWMESNTG